MTRAEEYLRRAATAEAAAEAARFSDIKEQLRAVARRWREMAEEAGPERRSG